MKQFLSIVFLSLLIGFANAQNTVANQLQMKVISTATKGQNWLLGLWLTKCDMII